MTTTWKFALATTSILAAHSVGCGANGSAMREAQAPSVPAAQAQAPAPALDRSLFSQSTGTLSETDLQRVLDARMDLKFPTRLGVVALAQAFDPEAPATVAEQAAVS